MTAIRTRGWDLANAAGALISMGSCIAGVIHPGLALPAGSPITDGVELYAQAYAVRALPLGAALLHQLLISRTRRGLIPLLLVAGAVQLGDAAIGVATHNPGMTFGAGGLAVLHLATAAVQARRSRDAAGPVTA